VISFRFALSDFLPKSYLAYQINMIFNLMRVPYKAAEGIDLTKASMVSRETYNREPIIFGIGRYEEKGEDNFGRVASREVLIVEMYILQYWLEILRGSPEVLDIIQYLMNFHLTSSLKTPRIHSKYLNPEEPKHHRPKNPSCPPHHLSRLVPLSSSPKLVEFRLLPNLE
jgi:hypothetical protein